MSALIGLFLEWSLVMIPFIFFLFHVDRLVM